jgi:PLP dependent protein
MHNLTNRFINFVIVTNSCSFKIMLKENLHSVRQLIPSNVTLVAVSKTKPISAINELYTEGQRHFGENKVQELVEKHEQLPKDIHWHLIGHLQTNKVKYVAPFVHLIHAVDSLKLLQEINKQASKNKRVISCLLQFHVAQEETKFGMSLEEANNLLHSDIYKTMQNIQISGVMGMASYTDDTEQIKAEFRLLKNYFSQLKNEFFQHSEHFSTLSMGMSSDFEIAIEEGSTLVRVGSSIFGSR